MNNITPDNLKYSAAHEWIKIEGDVATIGITDFAQSSLGDIVYLELPGPSAPFLKDEPLGVIESIKSVSDIFSPLTGEVLETNDALIDSPESCNQGPYESWLIKLKISNQEEVNNLLSAEEYQKLCNEQEH